MTTTRKLIGALLLGGSLVVAGCGGEEFNEENVQEFLVEEQGLDAEAASCMSDKIFAEMSEDDIQKLTDGDEPSPEATEVVVAATLDCVSGEDLEALAAEAEAEG